MELREKILREAIEKQEFTIACAECKKPMWLIKLEGKYGTKIKFKDTPFPGVPPYKDYWEKDQKTAKRTDCPHCGEPYLKALGGPNNTVFAKPYVLEFDAFT